jgi:hypothetical protein
MKRLRMRVASLALLAELPVAMFAQAAHAPAKHVWRTATAAELEAVLPARAQVEKEHIETEMRTATGVIDGRGRVIAAVVLITAGYSANGKYSHYLLLQAPVRIGTDIHLAARSYVMGWTREQDGLLVHLYEAETGVERGTITAQALATPLPVVSIKVWPPAERSIVQIGRFALPYSPED